MGYFEDMQVQEKLYTPNVTYNYDAFTFWSNDYTQKNGYSEQEHHIPANRVVIQQHPAAAYLKGIDTVQVMSPAQFQLTKRAKWNTNNMLHYTRLLSAIFNQFGQMLTIIVAAYNTEENANIHFDQPINYNEFVHLTTYFINHLDVMEKFSVDHHLENSKYDGITKYTDDYEEIREGLKHEFNGTIMTNVLFFEFNSTRTMPRFVTSKTIDDYIDVYSSAYHDAPKEFLADSYFQEIGKCADKLSRIRHNLSAQFNDHPDGLINTATGKFFTYADYEKLYKVIVAEEKRRFDALEKAYEDEE